MYRISCIYLKGWSDKRIVKESEDFKDMLKAARMIIKSFS